MAFRPELTIQCPAQAHLSSCISITGGHSLACRLHIDLLLMLLGQYGVVKR